MSARYPHDLTENRIPSGRQLPRSPLLPPTDMVTDSGVCVEDDNGEEEPRGNTEAGGGSGEQTHTGEKGTLDFDTLEIKTENILCPDSMLKGMKGYQPQPADLEFIKKMKEEKLVGRLQGDLEEVQRLLRKEVRALEQARVTRDVARAELNKFPSCEEVAGWAAAVLGPLRDLSGLDAKSLLAAVAEEDVRRATRETKARLASLGKMAEDKRQKETKASGHLEKRIASEQLKIQRLMHQLSDLTRQLAQEEARGEIKAEVSGEEVSGEEVSGKGRGRGKGASRGQATRSKRGGGRAASGAGRGGDDPKETQKASSPPARRTRTRKPGDEAAAPADGPREKAEERKAAARGRRKPPEAPSAQATAPRRSKRLASKTS